MPNQVELRSAPRASVGGFAFRAGLLLSLVLTQTAMAMPAFAQDAVTPAAQAYPQGTPGVAGAPHMLQITILEGEGALNNVGQRVAREPIVEVDDENHRPVAGVLLLFTIHSGSSGAGGAFAGASTLTVTTNAAGQAVATGLQANGIQGEYTVEVHASLGQLNADATLHQTNKPSNTETTQTSQENAEVVPPTRMQRFKHFGSRHPWLTAAGVGTGIALLFVLTSGVRGTTITAGAGAVHQ